MSTYDKEYAYYRWQAGPVERLHYAQTRATILPYLNTLGGTVLEIGGGDGIWTKEYVGHIDRLTFLDISSEMIARAQKRLIDSASKCTYTNDDFLNHEFPLASFDHIVSIRNLEYFTNKKFFITKIKNLLKEGGTFVLVTKSPAYNLHDHGKEKALHTAQIDIVDLIAMLRAQGLHIVTVRPAIFGKLFRFGFMRLVSNVLHRLFLVIPSSLVPVRLLAYLSESFLIYVKK